jgi:hypothetical protein
MASTWLQLEVRRVMVEARLLFDERNTSIFLHWRRGQLQASREQHLEGFELMTRMNLPMDKTDPALSEWILWELRNVPCHPERPS